MDHRVGDMGGDLTVRSVTAALILGIAAAAYLAGSVGGAETGTRTLKEQLSDKASDGQRVDNCGVPAERRGPVPRPDCAAGKADSAAAGGDGAAAGSPAPAPVR